MTTHHVAAAWQVQCSTEHKLVLIALAEDADEYGIVIPFLPALAFDLGDTRLVERASVLVRELCRTGYLERVRGRTFDLFADDPVIHRPPSDAYRLCLPQPSQSRPVAPWLKARAS